MGNLSNRLKSLIEAWEKGSKTAYGKREGLPDVDYWRRVGGQNIGFIGDEGKGRPITGFSKNRALLYSKIGVENSETTRLERVFRDRVKAIDKNGGITAEEYKERKASAKKSFVVILEDVLAENGLSNDEFNKILNFKPSLQDTTKDPRIVKVFKAVRSKMIEANAKKFGEPAPDGSTFGLKIKASVPFRTFRNDTQNQFDSHMVEWQTLLAHPLSRYAEVSNDQDKKQQDALRDFMASKDGKALKKKIRKAFAEAKVIQEDPKWTEGITNHYSKNLALRNQRVAAFKKVKSGVGKILNVHFYGSDAFDVVPILDAEEIIAWLDGKDNERLDKLAMYGSKPNGLANASKKFAEKLTRRTLPKKDLSLEWNSALGRAGFSPYNDKVTLFSSYGATLEFEKNTDGTISSSDQTSGYYKRVLFHELSHWAENLNTELTDASFRFLEERVGSESAKTSASLTGGKSPVSEICFSDQFTEVYVGRVYDEMSGRSATEVSSMGIQQFSYPEKMAALYRDDRDLFYHSCGVIFGSYGKSADV